MKTKIFSEEAYRSSMDTVVKEWWDSCVHPILFPSIDEVKLQGYYAVNPEASASIVMVHGFTEYTEKFAEVMYYFYQEGYSVFMYDQRGHGKSSRKVKSPYLVHVDRFEEYVEDLNFFANHIVNRYTPNAKRYLYGHSMGGCVSALYLEKYPEVFKRAVLSSPMLKMNFGDRQLPAIKILSSLSKVVGRNTKPVPGALPFSEKPDLENICATSKARFLYHHEQAVKEKRYQTCGATYGWVRAAIDATEKLQKDARLAKTPILICQAGDDTLVDNKGQNIFAEHARNAKIVRFPTAKHEIYRSTDDVLELYYNTIFEFFK